MSLLSSDIESYVLQHTTPESPLLQQLARETHTRVLMPNMLSGHLQGAVLSMFSRMIQPHRILEIGTFTGYSAICLAQGLAPGGLLYTIDINEELEDMVRDYLAKAGLAHKVRAVFGNALDVIPKLHDTFDLVFIDADKANYVRYYELVFDHVRPGGYIIADNVLWKGKVADPEMQDKDTAAIRRFNDLVHEDPRVENILLPLRDGLLIARKYG